MKKNKNLPKEQHSFVQDKCTFYKGGIFPWKKTFSSLMEAILCLTGMPTDVTQLSPCVGKRRKRKKRKKQEGGE
jgi:hypothetical protein